MEQDKVRGRSLLVFGGTEDGRELVEQLSEHGWAVTLCGHGIWPGAGGGPSRPVRPDRTADRGRDEHKLMTSQPFQAVIDATHPYAVGGDGQYQGGGGARGGRIPDAQPPQRRKRSADWTEVSDVEGAVDWLAGHPGSGLTTGSKDLERFTRLPDYSGAALPPHPAQSGFPPSAGAGLSGKTSDLYAGTLSEELNAAMLRQVGAAGCW